MSYKMCNLEAILPRFTFPEHRISGEVKMNEGDS